MSSLALELDSVLRSVDRETAALLEKAVRDALVLAQRRVTATGPADALGYPVGYFESTAGSFADEPLEVAREMSMQQREPW